MLLVAYWAALDLARAQARDTAQVKAQVKAQAAALDNSEAAATAASH